MYKCKFCYNKYLSEKEVRTIFKKDAYNFEEEEHYCEECFNKYKMP